MNTPASVEGDPTRNPASSSSSASPTGPQLSITTSQTSNKRFPPGCRGDTERECSSEVIPTTPMPRARASWAISTGSGLRPELEMTIIKSPEATG